VSIVARVLWAFSTFALVLILPLAEYGRFAFIQLLSSLLGPLTFGAFSNIIVGQLGAKGATSGHMHEIAVASLRHSLFISVPVMLGLLVASVAGILDLDGLGSLAVAMWVLAATVSAVVAGMLVAEGSYGKASLLALAQVGTYVVLLALGAGQSGVLASLGAAIGQLAPSIAVLLLRWKMVRRLPRARWILGLHGQSLVISSSGIPFLLLLWLLLLNISAVGGDTMVARYGLANQFYTLFMFLPPATANIIITRLAKLHSHARISLVLSTSRLFFLLGGVAAMLFIATTYVWPDLVPSVLVDARWEITLGVLLGGIFAARSPFAWVNAITNRPGAEAASGLASAIVLLFPLVFEKFGSIDVLVARVLAAVIGLGLSVVILKRQSRVKSKATRNQDVEYDNEGWR